MKHAFQRNGILLKVYLTSSTLTPAKIDELTVLPTGATAAARRQAQYMRASLTAGLRRAPKHPFTYLVIDAHHDSGVAVEVWRRITDAEETETKTRAAISKAVELFKRRYGDRYGKVIPLKVKRLGNVVVLYEPPPDEAAVTAALKTLSG